MAAFEQSQSEESAGPPGDGVVNDLRTLRQLRAIMAAEGREMAANVATLRRHRDKLQALGRQWREGLPPLSLLLDNMHGLVLRRAYREAAAGRLYVLFYGADAGALVGAGHQLPQVAQQTWYRRIHPADQAAYQDVEDQRERCRVGYTVEYRYLHARTGTFHWARETATTPYQVVSGRWMLESYILDITEQKRAEEALQASEARYRMVVEDQSEYIRRFDASCRLTFVNGAFCRLLQQARENLLGADLLEMLPEADARQLRRRLRLLTSASPTVSYELEVARSDGSRGWQEWTDRAIFDEAGRASEYQSVGRDITERKLAERRARYLLQHDPLTDLPNRALLEAHLHQTLTLARRARQRTAVLLLDLDGFKRVNDTQGHLVGDRLLRAVGRRLRRSVRAGDLVARLGGDEFAVVLNALDAPEDAAAIAHKLVRSLARPFVLHGGSMLLAASGGVALFPDHARTPVELIHAADIALYRAKDEGRNTCRLYAPAMAALDADRRGLEQDLRAALECSELELFYQPRIDLRDRSKVAMEALIRWRRPGHGMLMPEAFLEVAEQVGLALSLDRWVIEGACRQAATWRQVGLMPKVAVNVTAGWTSDPQLARELEQILARTALAPQSLELELTEHAVIDAGDEATIACLNRVADLGVGLAIDDFGSGFSSFAYLRRLPAQTIKIDRSFIAQLGRNREDETIVKAIIDLSHALGKRVVAEGVETQSQLDFLEAQGCDEAQGFLFCPPLPAAAAQDWLAATALAAAQLAPALAAE